MKKWNLLALVFVLSALFCLTGNGTGHSGGTMIDLGTLGGPGSQARSINDSGQIVGLSFTASGQIHAFLYSGEKMTDLGTLPGGTYSYAYGINNNGQIVGYSSTNLGSGQVSRAFLYSGGVMTDLGTLPGRTDSYAYGINNNGQIVGASGSHAFLYSGGVMTDLGSLGGTGTRVHTVAHGINDSGQIVGYSTNSPFPEGREVAFLYFNGKMTRLDLYGHASPYYGFISSYAYGINNNGQIVGYSRTPSGQDHAFLYNPEPDAVLSANPTSLSPSCVKGRNAASQNFTIQNNGGVP